MKFVKYLKISGSAQLLKEQVNKFEVSTDFVSPVWHFVTHLGHPKSVSTSENLAKDVNF